MGTSEAPARDPPGLRWRRLAYKPSKGTEVVNAKLSEALSANRVEFTREEIDSFEIEGLEWKCFIHAQVGGLNKWFQPLRPPRKEHPALVIAAAVFVVLSTAGFLWMCWLMVKNSYEFFGEVDVATPSGAGIAGSSALLAAATLYYILYPEGQLARDAVQDYGHGRVTFAYGEPADAKQRS